MSFETWALFALTETLLCLSPGPAVLLVLAQGLVGGVGPSLAALRRRDRARRRALPVLAALLTVGSGEIRAAPPR